MRTLDVRTPAAVDVALPAILEHLRAGGLIAYPTETVYGFGGAVSDAGADRLRGLKRRDALKPFLLLVSGPDQAPGVQWNDAARILATRFWPGPLTLALPASPGSFPDSVIGADGRVAVRASPHPFVQALTAAWGVITSTSANAPGMPPAQDAADVIAALAALDARDVLVLDGGRLPVSAPSTILATGDGRTVRMLREGAITRDQLRDKLAGTGIDVTV